MMDYNRAWEQNRGGLTDVGDHRGYANWPVLSEAMRDAIIFAFNLQTSTLNQAQYDDIVSVSLAPRPMPGIGTPGIPDPATTDPMDFGGPPDGSQREVDVAVTFTTRRWAEVEFEFNRILSDACESRPTPPGCPPPMGMGTWRAKLAQRFRDKMDPDANTAADGPREVFFSNPYLGNVMYDPMMPQFACSNDDCFEIHAIAQLHEGDGSGSRRNLEEGTSAGDVALHKKEKKSPLHPKRRFLRNNPDGVSDSSPRYEIDAKGRVVLPESSLSKTTAQQHQATSTIFTSSSDSSSAPLRHLSTSSDKFDYFSELQIVIEPQTMATPAWQIASHPSLQTDVKAAFIHAATEQGLTGVSPSDLFVDIFEDSMGFGAAMVYDPMTGQMISVEEGQDPYAMMHGGFEMEDDAMTWEDPMMSDPMMMGGGYDDPMMDMGMGGGMWYRERRARRRMERRAKLRKEDAAFRHGKWDNPFLKHQKMKARMEEMNKDKNERVLQENPPATRRQLVVEHTLRCVIDLYGHPQARKLAKEAIKKAFLDKFKVKLVALSPLIANIPKMDFSPTGKPFVEQNMDETPTKVAFATDPKMQAILGERPYCDYNTESGSPGISLDGASYTSGRASIFCDGLHDGLIVVNAGGFSDETKVPKNSNMRILIRGSSSDPTKTTPMEVRTIKRAYQWLFPIVDPNTGELGDDQVTPWVCHPEQWADGICDCNCGRADWDCMGDRGIPQLYVEGVLDNPEMAVRVNVNCPFGNDRVVKVPEQGQGELPPTCGQVKSQPTKYAYCEYSTGLPTSVVQKAYQSPDGSSFGYSQSYQKAPDYFKYLWEVVEMDEPLQKNREVGTLVETLGVSEVTASKYQANALAKAQLYVDTAIMEQSHDFMHTMLENADEMDPMCYSEFPPPHCTGGAVTFGGQTIQTTPVVAANVTLGMDLPAGTTNQSLMDDPDVTDSFRFALADTYGVAAYEVHITGFEFVTRRRLMEMITGAESPSSSGRFNSFPPTMERAEPYSSPEGDSEVESGRASSIPSSYSTFYSVEARNAAEVERIQQELRERDMSGDVYARRKGLRTARKNVDEVPHRELQPAHIRRLAAFNVNVKFEISQPDQAKADAFGQQMAAVPTSKLLSNVQSELVYVSTIPMSATTVVAAVKTRTKMPDTAAMAKMAASMQGDMGGPGSAFDPAAMMAMEMMGMDPFATSAPPPGMPGMIDPWADPYMDPYNDPYNDPYGMPGMTSDPWMDPWSDPYATTLDPWMNE
ncbi:unnamed protein product [Amoebophrya sp. A25]|nr:unnamed protein product [Amoebophrya sp. A25]|eukprot:GSA25T00023257001.1